MMALHSIIRLKEQAPSDIILPPQDAIFLSSLHFDVDEQLISVPEPLRGYRVNPKQYVGHLNLPSGQLLVIEPKIELASIFQMVVYVFAGKEIPGFLPENVSYEKDSLLFEPFVRLFCSLVEQRARRGLVKDYISRHENLNVLRGGISLSKHLRTNVARPDKLYCRFFENMADIDDNRIIRSVLLQLLRHRGWTTKTQYELRSNLHHFADIEEFSERAAHVEHRYHRLNEDYRPIHFLCSLFLKELSISESVGDIPFNGFVLDMNVLFERFVQSAFVKIATGPNVAVNEQCKRPLANEREWPYVKPDLTFEMRGLPRGIADAKYKRDCATPENSDLYQVISYCVALGCNSAFLIYPQTEALEQSILIRNSQIEINTRTVNLKSEQCIPSVEGLAKKILASYN
jgi:5-methylcytosine-specific restriction enzyme subunit McrC